MATLRPPALWLLIYALVLLGGAWPYGQRWFARLDPFGVYSMAVSRLSPFRRNPQTGKVVIGNPFDHLPSLPVRPGVVAMLAVLLGSTAFDGFSSQVVFSLADPFGRGWNLLGLAHLRVGYVLSMHPTVLAVIKVSCVVTEHIVAVIAAHDRALRLLPAGHQLTGQ
jgi:hypothetical protein